MPLQDSVNYSAKAASVGATYNNAYTYTGLSQQRHEGHRSYNMPAVHVQQAIKQARKPNIA